MTITNLVIRKSKVDDRQSAKTRVKRVLNAYKYASGGAIAVLVIAFVAGIILPPIFYIFGMWLHFWFN